VGFVLHFGASLAWGCINHEYLLLVMVGIK
jgi:hypothetical protein